MRPIVRLGSLAAVLEGVGILCGQLEWISVDGCGALRPSVTARDTARNSCVRARRSPRLREGNLHRPRGHPAAAA
jgi:hypothetical protein